MADLPSVHSLPQDLLELPGPVTLAGTASPGRRKKRKTARINYLKLLWARFVKRVGIDPPSDSSATIDSSLDGSQVRPRTEDDDSDEVDEIVVDRDWTEDLKSSLNQTSLDRGQQAKSADSHIHAGGTGTSVGHDSTTMPEDHHFLGRFIIYLRWELWPAIDNFFRVRFFDENIEERFHKEHWCMKKSLVLWSSLFLVANWVIGACTIASPVTIFDKIWVYGVTPILTFPLVVLIIFDFPRDRPVPYQVLVGCATWCWSVLGIIKPQAYLCGFYSPVHIFECGTKDFLSIFYYTSALQTIALFGLMTNRMAATMAFLAFFIFASALILPYNPSWVRNLLNFLLYHIFVVFVHYMHENSERRLFILREQLKNQFKATQKAQINERREADSKRRLTSYVRVPLNTALLAVQNMEASGAVSKAQEIEFMALSGSLVMMSKVLNDMLDFNRMDSGRFEILSKPYTFHSVIRTLMIPLRMATDARQLTLETHLDRTIDEAGACTSAGEDPDKMERLLGRERDGVVLGDAIRLRQIINNLASNACKFTPAGGRVMCTTRLLFPAHPQPEPNNNPRPRIDLDDDVVDQVLFTPGDEPEHYHIKEKQGRNESSQPQNKPPLKRIVVRIEVSDTGNGIPPREMAQGKLFSAFNQTEQGRQQGGKGTGLGLALVRQIVKLSGGRLGVRSKVNHGSTFWVELPLGVGVKVVESPDPESGLNEKQPSAELAGPLSVELLHSRATKTPPPNVMHSLMDQGGLVELKLANVSDESEPHVLTRTIGELSSGAQLGPPLSGPPLNPSDVSGRDGLYPRRENSSMGSTPTAVDGSPKIRYYKHQTPSSSPDWPCPVPLPPSAPPPSCAPIVSIPTPRKGLGAMFESPMIVLVVDDDRLTRTIMARTLSRLGCQVSTAENGEIALEMIVGRTSADQVDQGTPSTVRLQSAPKKEVEEEHTPSAGFDVVFLDNQMPVMSGLEVVTKLRELGRHDLVVGVTGNALVDDQKEYFAAGVDHILTKPVFEPSLIKMLTIAEERRREACSLAFTDPREAARR
ncbi:Tco5, signal transduction HAMP domain histidine kinase [Phlebopus sp. FC_14]|nr:Tco5, signal transduction HAMP domain histidine kinase [Phlebopus sp. FC_14]